MSLSSRWANPHPAPTPGGVEYRLVHASGLRRRCRAAQVAYQDNQSTAHRLGNHVRLDGILPVLQTPFDADDASAGIDFTALRREVEFCVACRVHGLVVPALASEFMLLTDGERRAVVETVLAAAGGRVPVVVNVSGPSLQAAREFAAHAKAHGAAAAMALPPYVRKFGPDAVVAYYASIAETGLPVVIQNAGPPFGANLPTSLIVRILQDVPGVAWIKEERNPPGHFISEVLAQAAPRLEGVFGGLAGLHLPAELARGATGCMPSAAVPDVLVAIHQCHRRGDVAAARRLHQAILPLLTLETSVQMSISKEVLRRRGIFTSIAMRDPEFPDPDPGDLAELDAIWPGIVPLFAV